MDIGCNCSCDLLDGRAEIFSDKIIKARKEHICCECEDRINKKEKYYYYASKFEGEWSSHKTCFTCMAIAKDLCCGIYMCGNLRDMIIEKLGFDYTKHVEEGDDDE